MRRKRKLAEVTTALPKAKKQCTTSIRTPTVISRTTHPVLKCYYDRVCTLREFILSRLPNASKRRAKLLGHVGTSKFHHSPAEDSNVQVAYDLLDNVLVGIDNAAVERFSFNNRVEDFQQFTQQLTVSTASSVFGQATISHSEIVDFAIWTIFFRLYPTVQKPPHVLCHGHARASATHHNVLPTDKGCSVPGLVVTYPNEYLAALKSKSWQKVHDLIGKQGDHIMVDLLVHCGLFLHLHEPDGSLHQLSGVPLSELTPLKSTALATPINQASIRATPQKQKYGDVLRKLSEIRLVRHRMLYTRAALNARGEIAFGLRHIHVFRRFSDANKQVHTVHIMKYIFPRQFGMHNVFTSKTDARETAQPFKDYTLREEEITKLNAVRRLKYGPIDDLHAPERLPKRLRNECFTLIRRMQILHKRCSYTQLLYHYCPRTTLRSGMSGSVHEPVITDLATPTAQVSAFCRAVIGRVFPRALFGNAECADHNFKILLVRINAFLHANRFETFTLEDVMLGMKIQNISWLCSQNVEQTAKMSLTDFQKRKEVFAELIYYLFDSFLIPLIRSNFHVTESSSDKNRLFYFRHDVWKHITEPALTHLKLTMLEEMGNANAQRVLNKRELGFSQIRLLPKDKTLRTISNLKRRAQVMKDGRTWLGKSINSVLSPAFSVLKYEKQLHPEKLGAALFSVTDIFPKLQTFRSELCTHGLGKRPLYFVKVDVKSCFDSLPQAALNTLAQSLPSCPDYSILNHAEISMPDFGSGNSASSRRMPAPQKRFHRIATAGLALPFPKFTQFNSRAKKPKTVFVSSVVPQVLKRENITALQSQHIGAHIVRIGKKFYRQKGGIPQGSVLSSLLCNFFYADFEAKHLGFLLSSSERGESGGQQSVLLRLIDDFLLVTTERGVAEQFVHVMHKGNQEYGISIKPEKSLVNFDFSINGHRVPKLNVDALFPYCGIEINTQTLAVSKDWKKQNPQKLKDSLTVEYSHVPGHTFRRKMLSGLKIQMHTMLLDTSHNPPLVVLKNIYTILSDVASKCFEYAKCLARARIKAVKSPAGPQKGGRGVVFDMRLINDISALTFALIRSPRHKIRHSDYRCCVSKAAVLWLTLTCFHTILTRKPILYKALLLDLQRELKKVRLAKVVERDLLLRAVGGDLTVEG